MAAPMSAVLHKIRTKFSGQLCCSVRFANTSANQYGNEIRSRDSNVQKKRNFIQTEKKVFRTLDLLESRKQRPPFIEREVPEPEVGREIRMKTDQDWTSVWPTAQSFRWSAVPLPIRQGAIKKMSEGPGDGTPPLKFANMELMKIPNFLHLTPKHITKHCAALRKYCTPWPSQLDSRKKLGRHFPMEVVSSDYCFSAPSIRDPRARGVSVKFQLDDLKLDKHARDKFIRLVDSRFNPRSGSVIIASDRCPLKKQNYDYCMYLLTALYYESRKVEPWESQKTLEDMEEYVWDINPSKVKVANILQQCQQTDKDKADTTSQLEYLQDVAVSEDSVGQLEPVKNYKQATEDMINLGENACAIDNYKRSVLQMLHKNKAAPPP